MQLDGVYFWYFKLRLSNLTEISKVYEIGLQRYRNYKIKTCGKDSIPLEIYKYRNIEIRN